MAIKEENIRLIFGLKIRQLRMDKRLSLAEVSKASGISISYLNEIEKGKKYPKPNKIALLAKALHVSYDWLVSLKMTKNLKPIAKLIESDLLTSLPLEIFGIEPSDLLDIISNTPSKISAFISTLIEIARNYNIGVENFYFSVLRSYQEMYENYFEDLEAIAETFISTHSNFQNVPLRLVSLQKTLKEEYQYQIDEDSLEEYPSLKSLRSVLIPGNTPRLLLNKHLSDPQKTFTLGREIGYNFMKLKDRAYTSSWIKINSFEQLLNNFKASYFSGALLIPKKELIPDLKAFIHQKQWKEQQLIEIMQKYEASPEMFTHRLTNIFPKFFGINQFFFLRFNHQKGQQSFHLNKELHLAGLYNPHANMINEHYCRRWVSLNILKDLEELQDSRVICQVQRSQYLDSDNEYLCISLAKTTSPTSNTNSSVTIGFLMSKEFKRQVKFWNDPKIPVKEVGVTCQRCSAQNCKERTAEATIYQKNQITEKIQESLEQLMQTHQNN